MGLFSSEPPSHFPVVQGRRLDGADVEFPRDLPADATLLIVSFRDELDPLSDQWARLGDRIADGHDGRLAIVEVPVVNSKLKMLGGLATMGIRGQVETEAEKERTVPIYVDVKAFRKALQVKAADVSAFLVARDGRIAWRGDGDIDMDEVTELEAAAADVLSGPAPPYTDHPDIDEPESDAEEADESEAGTPDELAGAAGADLPPKGAASGPAPDAPGADGDPADDDRAGGPAPPAAGPEGQTGPATAPPADTASGPAPGGRQAEGRGLADDVPRAAPDGRAQ